MAGIFITFEGVEGAGKTTQIALLKEVLERDGFSVCLTREPGGDKVAEGVRNLLLSCDMNPRAELLLFLASRAQNVAQVIRPALEAGRVVICDRYIDSSVAYQGVARGLGVEQVRTLNLFATGGLFPDITFLLDLSPEIGLARQQDKNRMEAESLEFHQKVRQGFLEEASNYPNRFCVIPAELSVEKLHNEIYRIVGDREKGKVTPHT